MTGLVVALLAAYGAHLVYTALVFGWTGVAPGPRGVAVDAGRLRLGELLADATGGRPTEALTLGGVFAVVGATAGWAVFGGVLPPIAAGLAGGAVPIASTRGRRARARAIAQESWPRLIEEIRLRATGLGRSIPQALFDVGGSAPVELRPAFEEARREWLLSTDFARTLDLLRRHLADATADVVCETLLVAHEVGGAEVDRTLAALADDRMLDLQGRKDAASRLAGARFARSFTLVVPLGMAGVGLSIGQGREAYATPTGQVLVAVGLAVMAGCWWWAGRVMRLPVEHRVFGGREA